MSFLEKSNKSLTSLLLIPYNFPQLKEEKLYNGIRIEKKKKETIAELVSLNLVFEQYYSFEQNMLENRFWLYESLSAENALNYNFKGIDLFTRTFVFDSKRKKELSLNSLVFLYQLRNYALLHLKQENVIKSRVLSVKRKGYVLSCFGRYAFLTRNIFFNKIKRNNKFSYSLWFIRNLNLLGILNSFSITKWAIKRQTRSKKAISNNFVKKYIFYYKKNYTLKSIISLKKK